MKGPERQIALVMTVAMVIVGFLGWSVEAQAPSAPPQTSPARIEPQAGTWKTWVLASGKELRLPAPPGPPATEAEFRELRALAAQRDAAALDQINFWDAGSPGYRWNQIAATHTVKNKFNAARAARALALVSVAVYDATIAAWDSKYAYDRPRPSELDPSLPTVLANPRSPS